MGTMNGKLMWLHTCVHIYFCFPITMCVVAILLLQLFQEQNWALKWNCSFGDLLRSMKQCYYPILCTVYSIFILTCIELPVYNTCNMIIKSYLHSLSSLRKVFNVSQIPSAHKWNVFRNQIIIKVTLFLLFFKNAFKRIVIHGNKIITIVVKNINNLSSVIFTSLLLLISLF